MDNNQENNNQGNKNGPNKFNINSYWIYGLIILGIFAVNVFVSMNSQVEVAVKKAVEELWSERMEKVDPKLIDQAIKKI